MRKNELNKWITDSANTATHWQHFAKAKGEILEGNPPS